MANILYIFLDEGGNFDFTPKGTRFFSLSALSATRPFRICHDLLNLKFDLTEVGSCIEYFHAAEDKQCVRDRVFEVLAQHLDLCRIDSVLVEKRKCGPSLRPVEKFYPRMLGYLLRYVLNSAFARGREAVFVYTDSLPVAKKKSAIEKGIKLSLASMLTTGTPYRMFHHPSKSDFHLQAADYCNWAIFRKWESNDPRSYDLISRYIRSEFDIFRTGNTHWY